jgi:hypothetical protein
LSDQVPEIRAADKSSLKNLPEDTRKAVGDQARSFLTVFGAPLVGHLADLTGSFKTSFAVLGGFTLATCALVPLIDREEPDQPA